jgi:hypothetical protein
MATAADGGVSYDGISESSSVNGERRTFIVTKTTLLMRAWLIRKDGRFQLFSLTFMLL